MRSSLKYNYLFRFRLFLNFSTHSTLSLFVSTLLLSQSALATVERERLKISQLPTTGQNILSSEQQQDYARAKQLFQESHLLYRQATVESRQLAIEKSEQALKIWRELEKKEEEAENLSFIGLLYSLNRENKKAITFFEQALDIWREQTNTLKQAEILFLIGSTYSFDDQQYKSLKYLKKALLLYKAENQLTEQGLTFHLIGTVYHQLSRTQDAFNSLDEALKIQRAENDLPGQVRTLGTIGQIYMSFGEKKKAEQIYNQAMVIEIQRGDLLGQANILGKMGTLQVLLGQNKTALENFKEALKLRQSVQPSLLEKDILFNTYNQGLILMNLAHAYSLLGDYQQAFKYGEESRKLIQKLGDPSKEAKVLYVISNIYHLKGDVKKQQAILEEALKIQITVKDSFGQVDTLNNIAEMHQQFGEYQEALNFYNQALQLARQIKSPAQEAETLGKKAALYRDLGKYDSSVNSFNQAQEIYGEIGHKYKQAQTLDSIAGVWRKSQDYSKARNKYQQALELWRQHQIPLGEMVSLLGITKTSELNKDYHEALDSAEKVLSLSRELKYDLVKATTFILMGRVYQAQNDYQNAFSKYEEAESIAKQMENKQVEANALQNIGKTLNQAQDYQEAIKTFHQEIELRQALNDPVGQAEAMFEIATNQKALGNLESAHQQIDNAVLIIESIRSGIERPDLRTSYFATVQKYYKFYIDLLMNLDRQNSGMGYDAKAFNVSERSRARTLLELLNQANVNIQKEIEPELWAHQKSLQGQLDAIEKQRLDILNKIKSTPEKRTAIDKKHKTLLEEYQEVQNKIRKKDPKYDSLYRPPLTLEQVQQQILDEDTVLLQYSLGQEKSYLWVVTKEEMTSYQLPSQKDIEKRAKNLLRTIKQAKNKPDAFAQAVPLLSQVILDPVKDKLTKKRIVVVADGVLQYIPFAALSVSENQQPLITEYDIINLPSSSSLATIRYETQARKSAPKALAVLADPVFSPDDKRVKNSTTVDERAKDCKTADEPIKNGTTALSQQQTSDLGLLALQRSVRNLEEGFDPLPCTRQEAEAILKLVPEDTQKTYAFGLDANLTAATNPELSQYRIVHLATHGILNTKSPELSGIVLSLVDKNGNTINGFLRLHEIFNLKLPAEIVVLSACQTGVAKDIKGEGLVGLTRGFMYAGSPRVLVSLWKVDDEATAEIMTRFYRLMLKQKLSPAEALRKAQLEMQEETEWKSPYYWAAFVLQGEWN